MVILGIDHGSFTGHGVLKDGKLVSYGVKEINNIKHKSMYKGQMFDAFYRHINDLIDIYSPDLISTERPMDKKNGRTTEFLVGYYSTLLLAAEQRHINVEECYPTSVKKKVAGSGDASKLDVNNSLKEIFKLDHDIAMPVHYKKDGKGFKKGDIHAYVFDASDALALAYYAYLVR